MPDDHVGAIKAIATNSEIRTYSWKNRGRAPLGYTQGMALGFARVFCKLGQADPAAREMAKANTGNATRDALAHYDPEFSDLGMSNGEAGATTLRHLFALLMGLGMRESSGRHCEGRDMAAENVDAETCETGLFQFSYNSRGASPRLPELIQLYAGRQDFLTTFSTGVQCDEESWENYGTGSGAEFQKLAKEMPRLRCRICGGAAQEQAETFRADQREESGAEARRRRAFPRGPRLCRSQWSDHHLRRSSWER